METTLLAIGVGIILALMVCKVQLGDKLFLTLLGGLLSIPVMTFIF